MLTLKEYTAIANRLVAETKLPAQPAGLYEPIRYVLQDGGKRLRPVLTLAAADAFGTPYEAAANQAVGIEMYHNFTLLHDDVMDRADMRRGRPTVHRKWNESTAILSGDAMLTIAGQLITSGVEPTVAMKLNALFNRTAIEVYEGQQYDMDFEQRRDVSVEEYLQMIRLKTSVLLGCAAQLGAIVAGATDEQAQAIYSYGEKLGLAFQLRDDLLDTYGDPATFGKEIGGDIANDKKTWLLITALAEDRSGEIVRQLDTPTADKYDRVRAVYDSLSLPQRCQKLIEEYAAEAIDALKTASLPDDAHGFFTRLANDLISRDK